ncbi:MAG: SHOCT domain-containing protein [Candidatus Hodarchaeota archaeon]
MSDMSTVGSGLVKLAYRGLAGFVVVLVMFVLGVTGLAMSFAGGLVLALCWVPMAYPEILTVVDIFEVNNAAVTDPVVASLALLIAGVVLLAVGFLLLALTYIIGKGSIIIDKELSRFVDSAFTTSSKDRISRLERLASLRERGVLTEEEFEQEKALVLDQQTTPYVHESEPVKKVQFVKKE